MGINVPSHNQTGDKDECMLLACVFNILEHSTNVSNDDNNSISSKSKNKKGSIYDIKTSAFIGKIKR